MYTGDSSHEADMLVLNLFGESEYTNSFISYSQVGDSAYDLYFTDRLFGTSSMTTQLWNDFTHANMKTIAVGSSYNLATHGFEELTLFAQGAYGWDGEVMDSNTAPVHGGLSPLTQSNAWEITTGASYEVFSGPLQGLWLYVVYNRDGGGYTNHSGARIALDYTISLFQELTFYVNLSSIQA